MRLERLCVIHILIEETKGGENMVEKKNRLSQEPGVGIIEQAWLENFQAQTEDKRISIRGAMDCMDICLDCKCPVSMADIAGWGGGAAGGAIG